MTVSQAPNKGPTHFSEQGSDPLLSIRYVKGVGPQRMHQLAQLGIATVEDACYTPPLRHEDRTHLLAIGALTPGEVATVRGRITHKRLTRARRGRMIFEITVADASGSLRALWFHSAYLNDQLVEGQDVICYGKVEGATRLQMIHPEIEPIDADQEDSFHTGRIVPIYSLTGRIRQRWFRQFMATVIEEHVDSLEEVLPESLRVARGWLPIAQVVRELHFPTSWDALARAKERLAFEELLLLQLALAQRRARTVNQTKPHRYRLNGPLTQGLRAQLPFHFTTEQERVLEELLADMDQRYPMYRLLQGDVGCGKTIVFMVLAAVAVQSGYQVAVMAPTELLAEQHVRVFSRYLASLGVCTTLLSQGVAAPERAQRAAQIADGTVDIVIGTHALIQRRITFDRLAFVIIDEQHKFGVVQRARLAKKAQVPDVLVLTATPIPRTLALTIYGDLAVSTIREMPPDRVSVTTRWLPSSQREELHRMIREELVQGRQGYIVYPLVTEGATKELKAATQMAKHLEQTFSEFRVGLLHGQMKPKMKDQTMQAFARGELHLLVSTVIVEVGLDVPNATIMVIEHPERFGLAQLHQLRGRIGRSNLPSICVVISDTEDDTVSRRLRAFVETPNGFELAEKDMQLRGPGEFFGKRQHGWLRLRLADLFRDHALLESAREEAFAMIQVDPALTEPSRVGLRNRLARFRQQPG